MSGDSSLNKLLDSGVVWRAEGNKYVYSKAISQPSSLFSLDASEAHSVLPRLDSGRGAIHEWFSPRRATLTTVLSLLAADILTNRKAPSLVAWIGRESWPAPCSLSERLFHSSLFIDPPNEKLKFSAIDYALRSKAVVLVVAFCNRIKIHAALSRRLLLAAQTGGTSCFLIRDISELQSVTFATARWFVKPILSDSQYPRWSLSILKFKGPQPLHNAWTIEFDGEKLALDLRKDVAAKDSEALLKYG